MKIYKVIGSIKNVNKWESISKEIAAKSKEMAIDEFYALLGSTYGKKRREIRIEDAYSIPLKEATDSRAIFKVKKHGEDHGE
ncbi:MAG: 50S ribosomal protein L18Ae [Thermoplasmata archaeon]